MESKQPLQKAQGKKEPKANPATELSGHLADIELKLDHIIETIKDSLHRNHPIRNRKRLNHPSELPPTF